ncbi:protein kinase domain-containing protein [Streptomyces sp. 8N616]|uniref:protein kinase domain-containing protein n=1 Tax=Streptomyces sp. 8N616 TaxID=3457414 RepID=UPI003FCF9F53
METGETPGGDQNRHGGAGRGASQALIGGRYELLQRLGRGGMGTVWTALDTQFNHPVVLKELLLPGSVDAEARAQWLQRVRREAQAVARIGHEHVVAVHDVVEADDQVWIVMEQVTPHSLADLLRERGRIPSREAARIGLEVLRALRALHAAGVLHGDVKPHNILFRRDGRAVLTDFGIAAFEGAAGDTSPHVIVGTPQYMAPELLATGSRTPAADLWSLGVTLYEAVEGRPPVRGSTASDTMRAVLEDEPPPLAGPLRPLIDGLLAQDPQERMSAARAEELLSHLTHLLGSAVDARVGSAAFPASSPEPMPDAAPMARSRAAPALRVGAPLITGAVLALLVPAALVLSSGAYSIPLDRAWVWPAVLGALWVVLAVRGFVSARDRIRKAQRLRAWDAAPNDLGAAPASITPWRAVLDGYLAALALPAAPPRPERLPVRMELDKDMGDFFAQLGPPPGWTDRAAAPRRPDTPSDAR